MKEIERKFLVDIEQFNKQYWSHFKSIVQYYLTDNIRIRVITTGFDKNNKNWDWPQKTFLTIKRDTEDKMVREEIEHEIDNEFYEGIKYLGSIPFIRKTRYHLDSPWDVDVFHGENEGLILAEIELESKDQKLIIPEWIGREVTNDDRYYNSYLAKHPFSEWEKK